ncbi:hypothetical protein [Rhizobium sp. R339]|uniref:hypothetical protein n=1 Tax=Rhizobium sp. R339 TaxID=1764273 RepID=UPI001131083E|nr:hypothetical protein [Rhizobium sp. R339]
MKPDEARAMAVQLWDAMTRIAQPETLEGVPEQDQAEKLQLIAIEAMSTAPSQAAREMTISRRREIREALSVNMDAALTAIDRLRCHATGNSDVRFEASDAEEVLDHLEVLAGMHQPEQTQALLDVAAERRRQIDVEGWTPAHDDQHTDGSLAQAAAAYALKARSDESHANGKRMQVPYLWPDSWHSSWWKPKDRRQDLVRAAALIIAEIERIDRASATEGSSK